MPTKCLLLLLDGLGDRGHGSLRGRTPLQAADTPTFDALAGNGCNGLYHPGLMGQAMPSELAHYLLFGYRERDFPGRGALEALGAGIDLAPRDVAIMARMVQVQELDGALRLIKDTPAPLDEKEAGKLAASLPEADIDGIHFSYHHVKGLHGVLLLRPVTENPSPHVTDTNPIRDGAMIIEPLPLAEAREQHDAIRTAKALKHYLSRAYAILAGHPLNKERVANGLPPVNALATQRAGRVRPVTPFHERYGLKAASLASGNLFRGLAKQLGMDFLDVPEDKDPSHDMAQRLGLARDALEVYDFLHVHTKAPDVAAHSKDCLRKRNVIRSLDRGAGELLPLLAQDRELLLVITADHSTPSRGDLIHSGEPVPLMLHGVGVRKDGVRAFDEISCANGGLGTMRGRELMLMILNYLDKARLMGLRDCPEDFNDAPSWPGTYQPFRI